MHALKFQMVMSPYGIMAHLFGPLEGRRHDAAMLQESGLLSQVEQHMTRGSTTSSGNYWILYGDPAYPNRPQIVRLFQGARLSPSEAEFNRLMSGARVLCSVGVW
jgi:hypothetical protein